MQKQEKNDHLQANQKPSEETKPANTFTLGILVSGIVRK